MDERWEENSTFGPPSQLVRTSGFLEHVRILQAEIDVLVRMTGSASQGEENYRTLSEEAKEAIQEECSLEGFGNTALDILRNPKLLDFLRTYNDPLDEGKLAEITHPRKRKRNAKTRVPKINGLVSVDSSIEPEQGIKCERPLKICTGITYQNLVDDEIDKLRELMSCINLKCWTIPAEAAFYSHSHKTDDENSLLSLQVAVIAFTNYARSGTHSNGFRRFTQHLILSTQTLGDIYDCIPCQRKHLPNEIYGPDGHTLIGYDANTSYDDEPKGAVICVEGVAHGDGLSRPDYADKLKDFYNKKTSRPIQKGTLMHDTKLSDLELRLHQPYWLVHQGECDHLIVFEQIRLAHASDPRSGYPLMIHQSPVRLSICQICCRLPPEVAVVSDPRIGQSAGLLCSACWRALGDPVEGRDDPVMVIPLLSNDNLF
ncbi:hypothetical protein BS47DRAFT_1487381 [Hydnum rufescens UP504]|uniref:snRNA-activating protein complex subunit 3 n=1 Tax=Hydnum rufescens UP504 TaxID=1448309 RepID=A0A9P6DUI4_9AGAM|nr:hypothetical protein BS47DRAFT_1487381 [Hydnum rufescens UP504]